MNALEKLFNGIKEVQSKHNNDVDFEVLFKKSLKDLRDEFKIPCVANANFQYNPELKKVFS